MTQRATGASRAVLVWEASLVGALFGLAALAWVATGQLGDSGMRLGLLTGADSLPWASGFSLPAMGLFLVTWTVMMVAMMFPAIAPVVVTLHRSVARSGRPVSTTGMFVVGYLAVWSASGAVVYAGVVAAGEVMPSGEAAVRVAAAALVVAGLYEFTPLKNVCLRQCRSPLAFVAEHTSELRRSGLSGTRVGAVHGMFCLGCCWSLMVVLVLLGMMSLAWMAAVTGVIFLEKVSPGGEIVGAVAGLALVGAGVALLAVPQTF